MDGNLDSLKHLSIVWKFVFSRNTLHLLFVTSSNFVFSGTIQYSAVCNFASFVTLYNVF